MGSSSRETSDVAGCCRGCGVVVCVVGLVALMFMMLVTAVGQQPPHFRLEYASVSLNATSNTTISPDQVMADWNIGFSVINSNFKLNAIGYTDLSVYVKSPLGNTTTATFPDFHQLPGKKTLDAVVRGPLPRLNTSNSFMLTFDVNLQTKTRFLNWLRAAHKLRQRKVTCQLLKIEIQPFQTHGVRLGNPVECHDPNVGLLT